MEGLIALIAALIALIGSVFGQDAAERTEIRTTAVIERTCPTATGVIVAAGGVLDAWAQMKTGDPNATVDVLPRDWIENGRELCAYYAPAPTTP